MTKDYAKSKTYAKTRSKTQLKKHKSSSVAAHSRSVLVVFVLLLVIAAGIAGYYYSHHPVNKVSKNQTSLLPPVSEAKAIPLKTKRKAPVVEAKEEPVEYEFYTLLPQISVPDPVQDDTPPGEKPGFWLQLMVYYGMRDATAFVDRLQLLGLDPVIVQRKSTKNDRILYIVVLGPFSTKENAVSRQQDLKKMNLSSYIYHVDPPVAAAAEPAGSTVPVVNAAPIDLKA